MVLLIIDYIIDNRGMVYSCSASWESLLSRRAVGEVGITYKLATGDWQAIQYFSTPPKSLAFSESDEYILVYEQPMIVHSFGITASPTTETIAPSVTSVSSPVNFGSAFTLDAFPTGLSKPNSIR